MKYTLTISGEERSPAVEAVYDSAGGTFLWLECPVSGADKVLNVRL